MSTMIAGRRPSEYLSWPDSDAPYVCSGCMRTSYDEREMPQCIGCGRRVCETAALPRCCVGHCEGHSHKEDALCAACAYKDDELYNCKQHHEEYLAEKAEEARILAAQGSNFDGNRTC